MLTTSPLSLALSSLSLFPQGWIPGRAHIRPTPAGRAAKAEWFVSALESYETVEDAILIDVLHYRSEPSSTAASSGRGGEDRVRKRVLRTKKKLHDSPAVAGEDDAASNDDALPGGRRILLTPNLFPYDLPMGTSHEVLWISGLAPGETVPDAEVTAAIALALGDDADFVWYENPKKSLEHAELHHVQVFTRRVP